MKSNIEEEIHIALATTKDIPHLVEYRIRFALELSGEQTDSAIDFLRNQMTDYFNKAMNKNSCFSIIARSGNRIAGIGSVSIREQPGNFRNPSGIWGYVMNMYTVPEFRQRGIATNILNALLHEGIKRGISAFELHATKQGENVYLKNGFKLHREPTLRKFIKEAN